MPNAVKARDLRRDERCCVVTVSVIFPPSSTRTHERDVSRTGSLTTMRRVPLAFRFFVIGTALYLFDPILEQIEKTGDTLLRADPLWLVISIGMIVPITLLLIFLLLYLNFRRLTETLIVMLSVPTRASAKFETRAPVSSGCESFTVT